MGDMLIARDPLGIKPLCYAFDGSLFAAASESVALLNLGFDEDKIVSLEPGTAITISKGELTVERFAESTRTAHCFFEWIYFANVASTLDDRSVYLTRTALGEELESAREDASSTPPSQKKHKNTHTHTHTQSPLAGGRDTGGGDPSFARRCQDGPAEGGPP